jgi:threonine aldolase
MMSKIDLRSDTVTRPSKEMLEFMVKADVGDDVYAEDPTVKELEGMAAGMSGKEAAVFAPSGTQSNLMGIMAHCQRGDEYIVGQTAHTYLWEGGGAAVLGSIQPQPLDFNEDGTLCLKKVDWAIKPMDSHHARTKLLCLENTTNGKVLPLEYLKDVRYFCAQKNLASHLDGARVFNAMIKQGVSLDTITANFNSVSLCLSKGLGAPIGSILCGDKGLIEEARRWRKMLGGGMRQAGVIAAAGIYALTNNIDRLVDDHDNAHYLAVELSKLPEMKVDMSSLQTNMFYLEGPKDYNALQEYLATKGIIFPSSPDNPMYADKPSRVRIVTHLDISRNDVRKVIEEIKAFYTQNSGKTKATK